MSGAKLIMRYDVIRFASCRCLFERRIPRALYSMT